MESEYLVVLITAPDVDTGQRLGRLLVEQRLAACVNLLPGIRSFYRWDGALQEDAEVLLIAKTQRERFERMKQVAGSVHPYQVPEIIALPLVAGSEAYLRWVEESLRADEQDR